MIRKLGLGFFVLVAVFLQIAAAESLIGMYLNASSRSMYYMRLDLNAGVPAEMWTPVIQIPEPWPKKSDSLVTANSPGYYIVLKPGLNFPPPTFYIIKDTPATGGSSRNVVVSSITLSDIRGSVGRIVPLAKPEEFAIFVMLPNVWFSTRITIVVLNVETGKYTVQQDVPSPGLGDLWINGAAATCDPATGNIYMYTHLNNLQVQHISILSRSSSGNFSVTGALSIHKNQTAFGVRSLMWLFPPQFDQGVLAVFPDPWTTSSLGWWTLTNDNFIQLSSLPYSSNLGVFALSSVLTIRGYAYVPACTSQDNNIKCVILASLANQSWTSYPITNPEIGSFIQGMAYLPF